MLPSLRESFDIILTARDKMIYLVSTVIRIAPCIEPSIKE